MAPVAGFVAPTLSEVTSWDQDTLMDASKGNTVVHLRALAKDLQLLPDKNDNAGVNFFLRTNKLTGHGTRNVTKGKSQFVMTRSVIIAWSLKPNLGAVGRKEVLHGTTSPLSEFLMNT